ncbi:MAG: PQQ-binding-like beta-propeller repeat protein, partial [Candidatus Aenigmatarchaeota archaeon]
MSRYHVEQKGISFEVGVEQAQFGDLDMFGTLLQIKEAEKDPIFEIGTGGSVVSNPLVEGGVVYFGACDHNFYAVDAKTGRLVWKFETKGPVCVGRWPAVSSDTIFFGSYDHNLYALDLLTGREKWRFTARDKIASSPVVHGGVVYFGCRDGNLYAVSLEGKEVWMFPTKGPISAGPVLHEGMLCFGSFDHNL